MLVNKFSFLGKPVLIFYANEIHEPRFCNTGPPPWRLASKYLQSSSHVQGHTPPHGLLAKKNIQTPLLPVIHPELD